MAYVNEVMDVSKPMLESFLDARGVVYWPSSANYLWIFPAQTQEILQSLEQAAILVRPKADLDGRLGLRITLGTAEQTQRLIAVLERCLEA
jgi:histidinol-phosphate aminotransferase